MKYVVCVYVCILLHWRLFGQYEVVFFGLLLFLTVCLPVIPVSTSFDQQMA